MLQTRRVGLVLATIGTLLLAFSSVASAAWERGTRGDDTLNGTDGRDMLVGRTGDDMIYPFGGRDMVVAGPGNDFVDALDGQRDMVVCGPGFDTVVADPFDRVIGCEDVGDEPLPDVDDGVEPSPVDPNDPDDL